MSVTISIRISEEALEILNIYAKIKKWHRSQAARIIMEEYLESKEVQQVIEEHNKREKEVKE